MSNIFTYHHKTIRVGDKVAVHQKISEEGKTRTQIFEGLVIAIKNRGDNQSFMVRKIATGNIGVERIFPVKSPNIEKIVVKTRGLVRRAKLYYLRGRTGRKALRVKEVKKSVKKAVKKNPPKSAAKSPSKLVSKPKSKKSSSSKKTPAKK